MVVGIGSPEKAREFASLVPFPVECLYVSPDRSVYKTLELYGNLTGEEGLFFDPNVVDGVKRLFFNKKTGEALKSRGTSGLKSATKNFKPLAPPEPRDAVQQGGLYVFKGQATLFAHKDEGTGDHALPEEVLAAASCGCA
mmetsp:Transcript_19463/g.32726  ORF Transcript_19463/g.32726 Transcript_19463/m.32726 type:complete len:140 (+) Transcript_19463:556-975(+)